MNFKLLDNIGSASPRPILFLVGEQSFSRFLSDNAYELAAEPKELYAVPNANHIDLYDNTDLIPFDKLAEFFSENLVTMPNDPEKELVGSNA